MYKNNFVHYFAKIMVDILLYGGIICLILVPIIAKGLGDFFGYYDDISLPYMLTLFISGICAIYILFNLKLLFKTLIGGNPFTNKNVNYLGRMSVASGLISAIYIINCFFVLTIPSAVVVLVFIIGCLFCMILKDIFKQAIAFKEENDLTV